MFIEHLQKYPEGGLSALTKLNNCSVFITSFSLPSFSGTEVSQTKQEQWETFTVGPVFRSLPADAGDMFLS